MIFIDEPLKAGSTDTFILLDGSCDDLISDLLVFIFMLSDGYIILGVLAVMTMRYDFVDEVMLFCSDPTSQFEAFTLI